MQKGDSLRERIESLTKLYLGGLHYSHAKLVNYKKWHSARKETEELHKGKIRKGRRFVISANTASGLQGLGSYPGKIRARST